MKRKIGKTTVSKKTRRPSRANWSSMKIGESIKLADRMIKVYESALTSGKLLKTSPGEKLTAKGLAKSQALFKKRIKKLKDFKKSLVGQKDKASTKESKESIEWLREMAAADPMFPYLERKKARRKQGA